MYRQSCFGIILVTSVSFSYSLALAGENEDVLDEITVTATRSAEKVTEVPASIESKKQEEIELDTPVLQKELFNSIRSACNPDWFNDRSHDQHSDAYEYWAVLFDVTGWHSGTVIRLL
jgi:hypothetical protein